MPVERWWEEEVKQALLGLYKSMGVPTNYDTQLEINRLLLNFSEHYPAFDAGIFSLNYMSSVINAKVLKSSKLNGKADKDAAIEELELNLNDDFYNILSKYFKAGVSLEEVDVAKLIGDLDAAFKQKILVKKDPNLTDEVFNVVQEIYGEILREMAQDIRGIIQKSESIFAGQRIILDEKLETDEIVFHVGARVVKIISDIMLEPQSRATASPKVAVKISEALQQYLIDQMPGILQARVAIEHDKLMVAIENFKVAFAGSNGYIEQCKLVDDIAIKILKPDFSTQSSSDYIGSLLPVLHEFDIESGSVGFKQSRVILEILDKLSLLVQEYQTASAIAASTPNTQASHVAEGNIKRVLAGSSDPVLIQGLIAQLPNAPEELQKELAKLAAIDHSPKSETAKEERKQRAVSDYPEGLRNPANMPTLVASLMYMGISYASDDDLTFGCFNSFTPEITSTQLSSMVKTLFKLQTGIGQAESKANPLLVSSKVGTGIQQRIDALARAKEDSKQQLLKIKGLAMEKVRNEAKMSGPENDSPHKRKRG